MTKAFPATEAKPDAAALYAAARALVPALRARSAKTDADRRVPAETIADFQDAGFFRVLQPRKFGGLQMEFSVFANLVRELSHGCASSAWVYAVMGELGWVMAMFPQEGQTEVWGKDPSSIGCAAIDPSGHAGEAPGGFSLSGRWRFVSGSDHAQWVVLTAPCGATNEVRQLLVRRDTLQTIDDWHVMGLSGTGSRTLVADKVLVPSHRTITQSGMLDGTAEGSRVHDYAVCRTPRRYLTAYSLSPVIVGLAERALAIVMESVQKKLATDPLADVGQIQLRVAEATADVETARALCDRHLDEADRRLRAGDKISDADIQKARFMASHMVRIARGAIDKLCALSGSGWIFDDHALNVVFRDSVAGATHRAMNFDTNAKAYARS
ncbi:MAG TPA: acyl-CoA dehydrogenase family protein, partial [Xanthobacteraceae bacterium]|nr:acyl-CoA dehydrogenase family protein [Xanthobacteraceae bacterium]